MAIKMTPNALTPKQWEKLRQMAEVEGCPSGDLVVKMVKDVLAGRLIPSSTPRKTSKTPPPK